jgi:hypothetical protein
LPDGLRHLGIHLPLPAVDAMDVLDVRNVRGRCRSPVRPIRPADHLARHAVRLPLIPVAERQLRLDHRRRPVRATPAGVAHDLLHAAIAELPL